MKYKITAVKKTPIAKKDGTGTWTKFEVKTSQTGDKILQLGYSHQKSVKDTLKVGSIVTGYIESKPWESNGKSGVNLVLEGITAEYVYSLLLKAFPDAENIGESEVEKTPSVEAGGWEEGTDEETSDEGIDF